MSSINKAILVGRIGKDPEMRYMPNGNAVCTMSLATSESWKDKQSGERKEATEWHRISMFDKLAEIAGQYLTKGALVYVEGKIVTRKWQDKDGKDVYTTEIRVDQMKMLGSKSDRDNQGQAPQQRSSQQSRPAPSSGTGFDGMDDDIPF